MNKFFVVLSFILLSVMFCSYVQAEPFLTCNPYAATLTDDQKPTSFNVIIDSSAPVSSPAKVNADGSIVLWYDMANVSTGQHSVVVQAANIWGVSANSAAYPFTKSVPTIPSGLRITK